mmetsp:Transcript_88370/g.205601  ORF Transcript_88370/g.205601 Transcript_88370/m.205601 type:complete len:284 (-) Transcript_88370:106-957(-)
MAVARALCACSLAWLFFGTEGGGGTDDRAYLLQTSVRDADSHHATLGEALGSMLSELSPRLDRSLLLLGVSAFAADAHNKPKGTTGVRFSRNISKVEEGSHMTMLMNVQQATYADDDPSTVSCSEHDRFGDNHCQFLFGSNLHMKVSAKIGRPVKEGSRIIIDVPRPYAAKGMAAMLASRMKPLHVECPACSPSQSCTISYMEHNTTIKIPPCPIPAGETVFVDKTFPLPSVPGIKSVEGHVSLHMNLIREDASTLGEVAMKFGVGSLETADGPGIIGHHSHH